MPHGELDWLVAAGTTVVRVHQHGTAARRIGGNAATVAGPDWAASCSPRGHAAL